METPNSSGIWEYAATTPPYKQVELLIMAILPFFQDTVERKVPGGIRSIYRQPIIDARAVNDSCLSAPIKEWILFERHAEPIFTLFKSDYYGELNVRMMLASDSLELRGLVVFGARIGGYPGFLNVDIYPKTTWTYGCKPSRQMSNIELARRSELERFLAMRGKFRVIHELIQFAGSI